MTARSEQFITLTGRDIERYFSGPIPKAGEVVEMFCVTSSENEVSIGLRVVRCCEGGPQWGHAWGCPKCPE
jgi:hypothetical protein